MKQVELIRCIRKKGMSGIDLSPNSILKKCSMHYHTLILNCGEFDPLGILCSQLLETNLEKVVEMLHLLIDIFHLTQMIMVFSEDQKENITLLDEKMCNSINNKVKILPSSYALNEEAQFFYAITNTVLLPGQNSNELGYFIIGVDELLQLHQIVYLKRPISTVQICLQGEVKRPRIINVPIGTNIKELAESIEDVTTNQPVYLIGGPLQGTRLSASDLVARQTKYITVFDESHPLVQRTQIPNTIHWKRVMAACTLCERCTSWCPKARLGYPLKPHEVMKGVTFGKTGEIKPFLNTLFCSECGLCELYACPNGISPLSIIKEYKQQLLKANITIEETKHLQNMQEVNTEQEYRHVSVSELTLHLGLEKYRQKKIKIPIEEAIFLPKRVKLMYNNPSKRATSISLVKKMDQVKTGEKIAVYLYKNWEFPVFATINGTILQVTENEIIIGS